MTRYIGIEFDDEAMYLAVKEFADVHAGGDIPKFIVSLIEKEVTPETWAVKQMEKRDEAKR